MQQLQTEKDSSIERGESSFMVFHIGVYVFVISVLKSGEYIVYETHPIGPELSGNGNGIIVKTFCKYELSQWVMRRCIFYRIESSVIPQLMHVTFALKVKPIFHVQRYFSECICFLNFTSDYKLYLNIKKERVFEFG